MLESLMSHPQAHTFLLQTVRLCVWMVLITAVFAPLERFFALRPARMLRKGWATDLGWYFVNALTPLLLLGPISAALAVAIHGVVPPAVGAFTAALPLWARMLAAMVVGEIGFYWGHRWSHELPLLWRFHAVHHSAEHIDYLVNTRAHPVDLVFTRLCGLMLLYATGLAAPVGPHPTLVPALVLFVGAMWSFFVHANLRVRLGLLEQVIATPAFHHWHHTREDHRDHNYAPMLPMLDRIFGTFYLPKTWPAEYGTDTPVSERLAGQLVAPLLPTRKTAREDTAAVS